MDLISLLDWVMQIVGVVLGLLLGVLYHIYPQNLDLTYFPSV